MHETALFSRRSVAAALPVVALGGATTAASTLLPPTAVDDAALLDLGRRWHVAWARLEKQNAFVRTIPADDTAALVAQDSIGDELFREAMRASDEILAAPVRTLRGLALKAQVVARAHDVTEPGVAPLEAELASEQADFERYAVLSLALDVLRLGDGDA